MARPHEKAGREACSPLPWHPATPLPGTHPRQMSACAHEDSHRNVHAAPPRGQPGRPPTNGWTQRGLRTRWSTTRHAQGHRPNLDRNMVTPKTRLEERRRAAEAVCRGTSAVRRPEETSVRGRHVSRHCWRGGHRWDRPQRDRRHVWGDRRVLEPDARGLCTTAPQGGEPDTQEWRPHKAGLPNTGP